VQWGLRRGNKNKRKKGDAIDSVERVGGELTINSGVQKKF
jgi:hypothetical protein